MKKIIFYYKIFTQILPNFICLLFSKFVLSTQFLILTLDLLIFLNFSNRSSSGIPHIFQMVGMTKAFPLGVQLILIYFIPRREIRSMSSRGPIDTLSIYCCLSERILHFKKSIGFLKIFKPRKCFIRRREMRSISSRVHLILFPFVVLVNVYCTFKNQLGFLSFLNLENVL